MHVILDLQARDGGARGSVGDVQTRAERGGPERDSAPLLGSAVGGEATL